MSDAPQAKCSSPSLNKISTSGKSLFDNTILSVPLSCLILEHPKGAHFKVRLILQSNNKVESFQNQML